MSNPSKRGAICYEAEASFGEDATTFATLRLPIVGAVDCSGLKHDKIDLQRVTQRRQEGTQWVLGTQSGTVKVKIPLTGHGSSTSGATAATAVETFLGKVFGNVAASAAAGTTFAGTGTASAPVTAASATFTAGALGRAGAQNDTKGNGQFFAVNNHTGTTLTLDTALDGIPAAAAVCYSAVNIYPSESPTGTTVASIRLLLQTANLQYECHGCFATEVAFSGFDPKEIPHLEITFTVAWWRYATATFPSVVATDTAQPAANAGGSLFVQDVGTATRNLVTYHHFTLDYKLGVEILEGPGGVSPHQSIIGARRTTDEIKISWVQAADAATTTPVAPGWATGTTPKLVLLSLGPTAGKAVGFKFPNVCLTAVPIQKADQNLNRLQVEGMAYTGSTTATDLQCAAMVMAFA